MNKDEQFEDDMDKLIQSARHLIELCRQEDMLDKIDKLLPIVSWTESQAVLDHIRRNSKK